jgi:regulator of nucleoside diphosphate kinase
MHPSTRTINRLDRLRLYDLLFTTPQHGVHQNAVRELLCWARAVAPQAVPPDTVTMNSRVRLVNLTTGCAVSRTLMYPYDASASDSGLSVFSALGAALLAARVGEEIPWRGTDGTARIVVDGLEYQPESAGHYDR